MEAALLLKQHTWALDTRNHCFIETNNAGRTTGRPMQGRKETRSYAKMALGGDYHLYEGGERGSDGRSYGILSVIGSPPPQSGTSWGDYKKRRKKVEKLFCRITKGPTKLHLAPH